MNIMNLYVYENRSMSNDLSRPLMLENLNVDTVQIHIPKEIDGTDMGTWAWWFVYQNAKREKYSIPMTLEGTTNDEGEEEYISTVGLNHGFTGKHGTVMYAIEALQADGSGTVTHEWHTKTCKLEVVYTLQGNQTEYDETETDIISALISRVNELITSGAEIAEIAETIENAAETAQEVIDSIPADYSELSDQVDANTAAIALKANQATTYTKTEVDALIDEVEVETDTTLEVEGAPADAAETGRQIGLLKADLDAVGETPMLLKSAQSAVANNNKTTVTYDAETDALTVAGNDSTYTGFYINISGIPDGYKCKVSFDFTVSSGTPSYSVCTKYDMQGSAIKVLSVPSGSHYDAEWIKSATEIYLIIYTATNTKKTTTVIFTNLAISGAAVSAEDSIARQSIDSLVGVSSIDATWNNGSIDLSGDTTDMTASLSTAYYHAIIDCAADDVFTISLNGGNTSRAYGFVDSEGNILEKAPASTNYRDAVITAPEDSAYLIVQTGDISINSVKSGESIMSKVDNVITQNGFDKYVEPTWTAATGVRASNGQTAQSNWAKCSGFIDIHDADYIEVTSRILVESSVYGVAFYDKNKNYLYGVQDRVGDATSVYTAYYRRWSKEAYYMRCTYHKDGMSNIPPFSCRLIKIPDAEKDNGYIRQSYLQSATDMVDKIRNAQNEPNISFWWITDIHFLSESSYTYGAQIFDAVDAIKYMDKFVKADFIVDTGDEHDGNTVRSNHVLRINQLNDSMLSIGLPLIRTIGNHDTHYQYSSNSDPYTYSEMFEYYLSRQEVVNGHNFSTCGNDFYIDIPSLSVRLVCVSCNTDDGGHYTFANADLKSWMQNAALNTPDGYSVLLLTHMAPLGRHNAYNTPSDGATFSGFLESYETPTKHMIGVLYGHTHMDATFAEPYLAVASDCNKWIGRTTEHRGADAPFSGDYPWWEYYARDWGQASEQVFNFVVLKPMSQLIDVIRFGAGVDRKLHYVCSEIAEGDTVSLTPNINAISWQTMDDAVATVENGTVTGVAVGMTGIRAYDVDGNYEMWRVSVAN